MMRKITAVSVELTEQQGEIFERFGRTSVARPSELARDLKLELAAVLEILAELKKRDLLEERTSPVGGDAASVYYVTANGLRALRARRR